MSEKFKVAAVQMDVAFAAVDENLARVEDKLAEAARHGAHLVVFPECALTGYCFDAYEEAMTVAEPIPGPATERITAACRATGSFAIVGMLEADGERLFNACVLVGPEGVVGTYRKVHMPRLGVDWLATPGDRPFEVHSTGPLRVGMNICYDGSFPEASRIMALAGADLLALPTNWPPAAEHFARYVIPTRALENHVYSLSANRIGTERGFRFIGLSMICHPTGRPLAMADHDREAILYAQVDPAVARQKHLVRVPGKHEIDRLADRRPEMYGAITSPHTGEAAARDTSQPHRSAEQTAGS
ncbi:MAG: carbon-nitrogen hydrolase family protein [Pirellulales bacterium]